MGGKRIIRHGVLFLPWPAKYANLRPVGKEPDKHGSRLARRVRLTWESISNTLTLRRGHRSSDIRHRPECPSAGSIRQEYPRSFQNYVIRIFIASSQAVLNRMNEIEIARQATLLSDEKQKVLVLQAQVIALGATPAASARIA